MSVGWRASRRRHTRSLRDWSSDVCSSDLLENFAVDSRRRNTLVFISKAFRHPGIRACFAYGNRLQNFPSPHLKLRTNRRQWNIELEAFAGRSEERRVGKECRCLWGGEQAEDGIRDLYVTGVQTCALPISWKILQSIPVGETRSFSSPRRFAIQEYERVSPTGIDCKIFQARI